MAIVKRHGMTALVIALLLVYGYQLITLMAPVSF